MALFTDAEIITLDDLLAFESGLVQVASSHGINVDTKISLAISSVSENLLLWLQDSGMSDPQWLSRRAIGLSTVVVTQPLQRWLCFESLLRFFTEAYNVQLNGRFQAKMTQYQQEIKQATDSLLHDGVGIVYTPLPKPSMPLVSVQQGSAPAGTMFVRTTWMDRGGNESALSPINGVVLKDSSGITVQMSEGADAPTAVVGWNVYVGSDAGDITMQNGNPLSIGSTWTLPQSGLADGWEPGDGQSPDKYVPISRHLRRG